MDEIDKNLYEIKTAIGKVRLKKYFISSLIATTFVLISVATIHGFPKENIPITLTSSVVAIDIANKINNYYLNKDILELKEYETEYKIKKLIKKHE